MVEEKHTAGSKTENVEKKSVKNIRKIKNYMSNKGMIETATCAMNNEFENDNNGTPPEKGNKRKREKQKEAI